MYTETQNTTPHIPILISYKSPESMQQRKIASCMLNMHVNMLIKDTRSAQDVNYIFYDMNSRIHYIRMNNLLELEKQKNFLIQKNERN